MTLERWEGRKRPPLQEEMEAAVAEHGLSWDREGFSAAVEANLSAGRYTLVFAVDEITDELKRVVQYLSEHSAPGVNVIALEIGYLTDGDIEVLVPQSYGQELADRKPSATGDPVAPDEASFMVALGAAKGDWTTPIVVQLLDWARGRDLIVWYGTGARSGSLNVGFLDDEGGRRAIFGIATSGGIWLNFGSMSHFPSFAVHDDRLALLRSMDALDGRTREQRLADSSSAVDLASLRTSSSALETLIGLLDGVVDRARSTSLTDQGRN